MGVKCSSSDALFNYVLCLANGRKLLSIFVIDFSIFGSLLVVLHTNQGAHIDFVVSSANKCIEGVPGFGYVIARKSSLAKCSGNARSLSLDLYAQADGLDKTGQFRYSNCYRCHLPFFVLFIMYCCAKYKFNDHERQTRCVLTLYTLSFLSPDLRRLLMRW